MWWQCLQASLVPCVSAVHSKGFQEFVKKAPGLLTPHVTVEVCNQIYLECLSYSQAKHQWEINFNQFLDALILLAERRHPWEKNRVQALIQNNIQPLWEVLFVSEDEPDAVSVRSGTSQRSTLTKVGPVKAGAAAIAAQSGLLGKGARRRSVLRTSSSGSMSRSRSMPPQNNGLTPVGEEDTELADVVDEEVKEEGETMDLKPAPRSRPAISERKIQAVPNGVSPELVEKLKVSNFFIGLASRNFPIWLRVQAQNDQLVATIKDLIGAVKKLQGENQVCLRFASLIASRHSMVTMRYFFRSCERN